MLIALAIGTSLNEVCASEEVGIYIKCKLSGPGDFANLEMNYYVADAKQQLLNDNKSDFGKTVTWTKEIIRVDMPAKDGNYVTFLNRLTGELRTYTEGKELKTQAFGKCTKTGAPKKKF